MLAVWGMNGVGPWWNVFETFHSPLLGLLTTLQTEVNETQVVGVMCAWVRWYGLLLLRLLLGRN
jgi:hypothetical protein